MKNSSCCIFLLILLLLVTRFDLIAQQSDSEWNKKKAAKWFKKHEWLTGRKPSETTVKYDQFGRIIETALPDTSVAKVTYLQLHQLKPHKSINKLEFAKQYHANKLWWDKAFAFLEEKDLAVIKPGKYAIDGDNVFATVTEGTPKRIDTTKWESHHNYQDIHYVIKGKEKIGVASVSSATVIKDYDPSRDLVFYNAEGKYYTADSGNFFIFFPIDAHRPNLKLEGYDIVKKIVIKIRRSNH